MALKHVFLKLLEDREVTIIKHNLKAVKPILILKIPPLWY